jgi:hypothetical protein
MTANQCGSMRIRIHKTAILVPKVLYYHENDRPRHSVAKKAPIDQQSCDPDSDPKDPLLLGALGSGSVVTSTD